MLEAISERIKSVFTNYLLSLMVVSGLILYLFYTRTISEKKFPVEYKIAKFGGLTYVILGVVIFLFIFFFS